MTRMVHNIVRLRSVDGACDWGGSGPFTPARLALKNWFCATRHPGRGSPPRTPGYRARTQVATRLTSAAVSRTPRRAALRAMPFAQARRRGASTWGMRHHPTLGRPTCAGHARELVNTGRCPGGEGRQGASRGSPHRKIRGAGGAACCCGVSVLRSPPTVQRRGPRNCHALGTTMPAGDPRPRGRCYALDDRAHTPGVRSAPTAAKDWSGVGNATHGSRGAQP
jgi:hypothetical protein